MINFQILKKLISQITHYHRASAVCICTWLIRDDKRADHSIYLAVYHETSSPIIIILIYRLTCQAAQRDHTASHITPSEMLADISTLVMYGYNSLTHPTSPDCSVSGCCNVSKEHAA